MRLPSANKGDSHLVADPAEKAMHDKIVSLVERMLALHKQPTARTLQEQQE